MSRKAIKDAMDIVFDDDINGCGHCGGRTDLHPIAARVEAALRERDEEIARLREENEKLSARWCSHGDYRMVGTTDCSNSDCTYGRTEFYVIGEGLCIECQHARADALGKGNRGSE